MFCLTKGLDVIGYVNEHFDEIFDEFLDVCANAIQQGKETEYNVITERISQCTNDKVMLANNILRRLKDKNDKQQLSLLLVLEALLSKMYLNDMEVLSEWIVPLYEYLQEVEKKQGDSTLKTDRKEVVARTLSMVISPENTNIEKLAAIAKFFSRRLWTEKSTKRGQHVESKHLYFQISGHYHFKER